MQQPDWLHMREDLKEHFGRFVIKVAVAALIAGIVRHDNYLLAFSFWVSLYAVFAVLYALLGREKYSRDRITYWDEAMWLIVMGLMLQIAGRPA